jgi:hypothetical protein
MIRIISFTLLIVLFSCDDKHSNQKGNSSGIDLEARRKLNQRNYSLLDSSAYFVDSVIRSFINQTLQTSQNEDYTFEIHRAQLNPDQVTDAIISVNRLSYAQNKAALSGYQAQAENLGYMGPFNLFIYYDGANNSFEIPTPVPSSPLLPLRISFEHISSNKYKDLVVDFRIRNSSYKEIYFLFNNKPSKVFQWKNFDGLGTKESEAYSFEFNPGNGPVRDILVFNAKIEQPIKSIDPFIYKPTILGSQELIKRFFYIPAQGKFFSTKDGPEG